MFQRSSTYVMSTKYGVTTLLGRKSPLPSTPYREISIPLSFPPSLRLLLICRLFVVLTFCCNTEFYAEDGPPVEVGDLLNASFPNYFAKLLHQRLVHIIAEKDKYVVSLHCFSHSIWKCMVGLTCSVG